MNGWTFWTTCWGNTTWWEQTSFKGDRTYYPPEDTLVYYLGVDMMDGVWLVISLEDGVVTGCATGIT